MLLVDRSTTGTNTKSYFSKSSKWLFTQSKTIRRARSRSGSDLKIDEERRGDQNNETWRSEELA